ncbi:MAG: hypothetical protein KJ621_02110 [Proteobacteria bacterium]|nr:hypothetical protein [Pseudomonadota bacterium]MBU1743064.1 hypothetical protein [Pseudomonadota bacterium]
MLGKPSFPIWLLCVAGGAFGVLVKLSIIPFAALIGFSFWIVAGALALLVLACIIPGL